MSDVVTFKCYVSCFGDAVNLILGSLVTGHLNNTWCNGAKEPHSMNNLSFSAELINHSLASK